MAKRRSFVNVGGGGRSRADWWKKQLGTHYYSSSQGGGFSEQYQAVLDFATSEEYTLPSSQRQAVENAALQLILNQAGLWDKVLLFLNYHTDGDANFATINWKNPEVFQATIEAGAAFTALEGFRSDGDGYIHHHFTMAEVDQEAVCYFAKGIDNAQAGNSFLFGTADAGTSGDAVFINPRNASDQMSYRVSSSSATVTVTGVTDSRNRLCIGRDGSNVFHSINGAAKVSSANTFGAVADARNLFSVAYEGNAGAAGFNTRGTAYLVVTDLLSNEEIAVMDTALDALTT